VSVRTRSLSTECAETGLSRQDRPLFPSTKKLCWRSARTPTLNFTRSENVVARERVVDFRWRTTDANPLLRPLQRKVVEDRSGFIFGPRAVKKGAQPGVFMQAQNRRWGAGFFPPECSQGGGRGSVTEPSSLNTRFQGPYGSFPTHALGPSEKTRRAPGTRRSLEHKQGTYGESADGRRKKRVTGETGGEARAPVGRLVLLLSVRLAERRPHALLQCCPTRPVQMLFRQPAQPRPPPLYNKIAK